MENKLVFVILAYGQSEYLDDCINSLLLQTISCEIFITTSTPNEYIDRVAKKNSIEVIVNNDGGSISSDWNFALHYLENKYICLAHQDDIYHPEYADSCLKLFNENPNLGIVFTASNELIDGKVINNNKREIVKKILRRYAFVFKSIISSKKEFKRLLSFGNPIPCPSVTYNTSVLNDFEFSNNYTVNLDWDAWVRISHMGLAFGFVSKELLTHRIHNDSETQKGLKEDRRSQEDFEIFKRFWPDFIAKSLLFIYSFGY